MIREDEEVYQERLCQGFPPKKAGHHLSSAQWALLDRFAELVGIEPLPPVYQMIFEDVKKERNLGQKKYKDNEYHVLGKDIWEVIKRPRN